MKSNFSQNKGFLLEVGEVLSRLFQGFANKMNTLVEAFSITILRNLELNKNVTYTVIFSTHRLICLQDRKAI